MRAPCRVTGPQGGASLPLRQRPGCWREDSVGIGFATCQATAAAVGACVWCIEDSTPDYQGVLGLKPQNVNTNGHF